MAQESLPLIAEDRNRHVTDPQYLTIRSVRTKNPVAPYHDELTTHHDRIDRITWTCKRSFRDGHHDYPTASRNWITRCDHLYQITGSRLLHVATCHQSTPNSKRRIYSSAFSSLRGHLMGRT